MTADAPERAVGAPLRVAAVAPERALKGRVFDELRRAILDMDVYGGERPPRLDERRLAAALGVSRTPVREALSRLEQEGLVRNVPRRGMFVVRKSRREIVEIIELWAALESMAARLATTAASDEALAAFGARSERYADGAVGTGRSGRGALVGTADADEAGEGDGATSAGEGDGATNAGAAGVPIDEYSERNIAFHQEIIALGGNETLIRTARRSFDHMHAIRASTIRDPARTVQSVIDHRRIVEALLARRAAEAERLVRDHALNLARHVERNVHFLD